MTLTRYSHLLCCHCGRKYEKSLIHSYCKDCTQPLLAKYDTNQPLSKNILAGRPLSMWRYKEMLPVEKEENMVTLGEGMTPIIHLEKLGATLGLKQLLLKEEGSNPTGSFKARGLSMAVSKAKELGINSFAIPTAGNAGSALAAYVARMGGTSHIYMPISTPAVFKLDCEIMGANVKLVEGSIKDAGAAMARENTAGLWWDVSTLKEPFRLEGKKSMGYEIAEQLNWQLPDVIIYPTGGGTGLIGIWKAFQEMLALEWISQIPTRMIAVQTVGCNPIVKAFREGKDHAEVFDHPALTIANGLRVPKAFGDRLILEAIYSSGGQALDVTEEEMLEGIREVARKEGLFLSPEGAATYSAAKRLVRDGMISKHDQVVILNTGSPYKYVENLGDV